MNDMHAQDEKRQSSSRNVWILTVLFLVAAAWLWTRHQSHLLAVLPYLLVLACPLMHLFHHHGHHSRHSGKRTEVISGEDAKNDSGKNMKRDV